MEPIKLDVAGLYRTLRIFEEHYERLTGEHVPSAVAFERYRAGELDDQFTSLWMSYYEALERRAEIEGEDHTAVIERTLEPLGA